MLPKNELHRLALTNMAIIVVCLLLANFIGHEVRYEGKEKIVIQKGWIEITYFYAFMTAGCGILTFFGLLDFGLKNSPTGVRDSSQIQFSIAATTLVVFIISYSVTFYWDASESASTFFQTMFPTFAGLIGVVFAFYFGTTAAVQITRENRMRAGSSTAPQPPES